MGRADDYFAGGDWNVACYECNRKRKFSTMRKNWQGYYVCPEHWEPRQPQDFVKNVIDDQTVPVSQTQVFVPSSPGTNGLSTDSCGDLGCTDARPGYGQPGCMIPKLIVSGLQLLDGYKYLGP
jgi:hypothetical protein